MMDASTPACIGHQTGCFVLSFWFAPRNGVLAQQRAEWFFL